MSPESRLGADLLGFAGAIGGPALAAEQPGLLFLAETIALPFDVDGGRVMKQPIEDRRGEDLVVEDLAPVDEALVAGDDEAGSFVAPDEQAEEQAGFLAGQRAGSPARPGSTRADRRAVAGSARAGSRGGPGPGAP